MTREQAVVWFAGLFEGEGSFAIYQERLTKGLALTSTDLDVLEKVKEFFGGNIFAEGRIRKINWKQAYKWYLCKEKSKSLVSEIYPYLLSRRKKRADYYLKLDEKLQERREVHISRNEEILRLYKEGMTQGKIAKLYDLDRTSVTKVIGKLKMVDIA